MMNSTPSIGRVVARSISAEQGSALWSSRCVYCNVICDNDLCRSCVGMLLGCEVLGGEAASVELYSQ